MGNLVDFVDRYPGLGQTKSDDMDWEITGVLLPTEALLLCGGNQSAVNHQRGRRIHPLCNPILALFQARPISLLQWNGILQPADPDDLHAHPLRGVPQPGAPWPFAALTYKMALRAISVETSLAVLISLLVLVVVNYDEH